MPFTSNPKLLALIVLAFSDSEKVSTTVAFDPMPFAPFCGITESTVGPVGLDPAPVVNVLEKLAFVFPDRSRTPVPAFTVTVELGGNGDSGANVINAPVESRLYVPASTPLYPPTEIGTVELFTVVMSMTSLKVSTTVLFTETLVAPFAGLTLTTEGPVVLAVPELTVVNAVVNGTITLPASSVSPLTVTV
jgi:hypothetical protein